MGEQESVFIKTESLLERFIHLNIEINFISACIIIICLTFSRGRVLSFQFEFRHDQQYTQGLYSIYCLFHLEDSKRTRQLSLMTLFYLTEMNLHGRGEYRQHLQSLHLEEL